MNNDFSNVTEIPGHNATKDQISIMITRYSFARDFTENKDVLEVACGAGMGLGFLAKNSKTVVGGDIDPKLTEIAIKTYRGDDKVKVLEFDAQNMPFGDSSFDVIIIFEAIYYIPDIEKFMSEVKRVLRKDGKFMISSVNREWHGFNPSPNSIKYYSAKELKTGLSKHGFQSKIYVGFPDAPSKFGLIISGIRRIAVFLRLIPKTMKGKERLKRLFYGNLIPIPTILSDEISSPEPLFDYNEDMETKNYKKIYVHATIK